MHNQDIAGMHPRYSSKDIAEMLDIAHSTARQWVRQFDIPHHESRGRSVFNEDALSIFKSIKNLKDKECGLNTIRRVIGISEMQPGHSNDVADVNPDTSRMQQELDQDASPLQTLSLMHEIQALIDGSLERHGSLAEKYAKAAHEIGRLEERAHAQAQQLQRAQERIQDLERQVQLLEAKRPWWQFWG